MSMRTGICECKHCGVTYEHQYSGSQDINDVPREFRDSIYCPECKEAIVVALSKMSIKFAYQFVETDETNLDTILKWEREYEIERLEKLKIAQETNSFVFLPKAKRVFANVYNTERNESSITEEIIGRDDKLGRIYRYSYWPSLPKQCKITVCKRMNLIANEPVSYKIQK